MKVLIVCKEIIPVTHYGGVQRDVWYLGKEMVKMGHEVSFLVLEGSKCDFGQVLPLDMKRKVAEQIPDSVDIVNYHYSPDYVEETPKPYLVSVHGNRYDYREFDLNSNFISKNHALRYGSEVYVYNGMDWNDYSVVDLSAKRDYFHFLGKAAWRIKNVKGAIDTIKKTKGERLKVMGGYRLNLKMGMRFTLSHRISFHGMVGGLQKDKLLNHSKGLLLPVRWHEPFGLAVIESLYFGCPVFATPYGSLPELVNPEVGFLSNKMSELVDALESSNRYFPGTCHDYAREMFNSRKMAQSYLELFERILAGETLNRQRPKLRPDYSERFLDWIEE